MIHRAYSQEISNRLPDKKGQIPTIDTAKLTTGYIGTSYCVAAYLTVINFKY